MLRVTKLTDYGVVVMHYLALQPKQLRSAQQIAQAVYIKLPTVSKLLKTLLKFHLVVSVRGTGGGYRLAQEPAVITLADIIAAIEGGPALTECSSKQHVCAKEPVCAIRSNWQLVNKVVLKALKDITLLDMTKPMAEHPIVLHGIQL